jgi:hypothetical protein
MFTQPAKAHTGLRTCCIFSRPIPPYSYTSFTPYNILHLKGSTPFSFLTQLTTFNHSLTHPVSESCRIWTRPVYLESSLQDLPEDTNMIQHGLHLTQINSQGPSISTTPELLQHLLTSQGLLGHLLGHLVLPCRHQLPYLHSISPPADMPRHHVPQSRNHLGTIQVPSRHWAILVLGTISSVWHIKTPQTPCSPW